MRHYTVPEGYEVRGFVVRLYPSKDDEAKLEVLSNDMRRGWNWLVKQVEDVLDARQAYAVRNGLVGARPTKPNCDGLSPDATKAVWEEYRKQLREWHNAVYKATNKVPECAFRSTKEMLTNFGSDWGYQLLAKVIGWRYDENDVRPIKPNSNTLQSLWKNYWTKGSNQRRKKRRKSIDPMPLQTRSGDCFETGDFGSRGHTHKSSNAERSTYYNCQVSFNGLKIRGRLPGKLPEGRILEGVSIRKEADGWYASIKVEVPISQAPPAIPGSVVGIDMGLDNIAAVSEVRVVENPDAETFEQMGSVVEGHAKAIRISNARGKAYAERIAARQAEKKPVGRLQQKARRHVRHQLHNDLIKPLSSVETIKIEELNARIGQMGSSKQSVMRTAAKLLKEKLWDRVREVKPHYTSQDCSQCGFRSKETWSYEHGRFGECPKCGHKSDRDINAARNIAAKPVISLPS